jgi:hypothetical protein
VFTMTLGFVITLGSSFALHPLRITLAAAIRNSTYPFPNDQRDLIQRSK